MKKICLLFFLSTLAWGGYRLVSRFQAQNAYLNNLKNVVEADSIPVAEIELKKALNELEKRELTNGSTSILWVTSNDDIGLWYNNLSSLLNELSDLPKNSSAKEKTKMLMKLKKALIDENKEKDDNLYFPDGIYLYPHNRIVALWGTVSIVLTILFFFLSAKKFSWYKE